MSDAFETPHVEVKRDRFGRYLLPHPRTGTVEPWTRVTTLARTLSDEYALNQWRIRQTVIGIGQRADLAALAAATHPDATNELQEIGDKAQAAAESDKGANLGRALHTFSQRLDGGTPSCPPPYLPYLDAYQRALVGAGFDVRPRLIERIVVCPEIPAAGQFDRLLAPPGGGRLVVGDLKTAKLESITYAWLEIGIQLSVYAHATAMWDHAAEKYQAMPDVDLERAIVMHLPQDVPPDRARCDLYQMDILAGWEAALTAKTVRALRSASRKWATKVGEAVVSPATAVFDGLRASRERVGDPPLVPATIPAVDHLAVVQAAVSRAELSALWRTGTAAGWWSPELEAAGKARLAELAS